MRPITRRTTKPFIPALLALVLLLAGTVLAPSALAQDRVFNITGMFTANDQGQVLANQTASGILLLKTDGSFALSFPAQDQGKFRYSPANPKQPKDMIFFTSATGYQYFAYVQGAQLLVWLKKTAEGANLYLNAAMPGAPGGTGPQAAQPPATGRPGTGGRGLPAVVNGRFSATVMYGDSSGPGLMYQDRVTGELDTNEKGVVLRPDGTFALRAEFGHSVTYGQGIYQIRGNQVGLRFSDGSGMTLLLENGGRNLNWYGSGGVLISEFFFMGVLGRR